MAHSKYYTKLLNSKEWNILRYSTLKENPICERCKKAPSRCVHHIKPVETGNTLEECRSLAFSRENLMALCTRCHSYIHKNELKSFGKEIRKQREEARFNVWRDSLSKRFVAFLDREAAAVSDGEGSLNT